MEIKSKLSENTLCIALSGELDECSADETRDAIDSKIDANIYKLSTVALDMSNVTFMDSTGVGVVIGRYKKLKALGKLLVFSKVSYAVDKVFNIAGIYSIIPKTQLSEKL